MERNNRIYNFSSGPAVLPLEVLESARESLISYAGSGIGVMEISHRSELFAEIIGSAESLLRELLGISPDYRVLFTTGGATQQFSMVPLNLTLPGQVGNYLVSGIWAEKALEEARRFKATHIAGTSKESNYKVLPNSFTLSENAAYLHFTSNNTLVGTQWQSEPSAGSTPLVCDASSDLLSRQIDVNKYGVIYAGAQKNLGIAGVTVVIIRKELLERVPTDLPINLSYKTYSEHNSLYNTPPTFPIFITREVLRWIKGQGGLSAMEQRNREKAALLYNYLNKSSFYIPVAATEDRSFMNVTFTLREPKFDKEFTTQADNAGLSGLAGHRLVGGMRASIYNAFPREGVLRLIDFMENFTKGK